MILKYTLFVLILIKVVLCYKQYKFHELCQGNKFKTIFDKITNNKPEVKLNEGELSAALIQHRWNSTSYKKFYSCDFNVKVDSSYNSGSGIFASIKKLKLREKKYDEGACMDFIRFTYKNGTSTRVICGNINTSVKNNLIRNFFDETTGEMRVEIFIDTSSSLSYTDPELEVDLVFTAYSTCYDDSTKLMCSPTKCISDVLRDDMVINCPPPGCSDESECVNTENHYVISTSTTGHTGSSKSSWSSPFIVVPTVMVVIGALAWVLCSCNKQKPTTNTPNNDDHIQELQPTARSDLDSYLEFQDVRPPPTSQQHERILPYASQPMPSAPRPMPSAPQMGFKDDPPAYDALFNTEANKRANV